jgi:hypothetical protein
LGHVARKEYAIRQLKILFEEPDGKTPRGGRRIKCKDVFKMGRREI